MRLPTGHVTTLLLAVFIVSGSAASAESISLFLC